MRSRDDEVACVVYCANRLELVAIRWRGAIYPRIVYYIVLYRLFLQ